MIQVRFLVNAFVIAVSLVVVVTSSAHDVDKRSKNQIYASQYELADVVRFFVVRHVMTTTLLFFL